MIQSSPPLRCYPPEHTAHFAGVAISLALQWRDSIWQLPTLQTGPRIIQFASMLSCPAQHLPPLGVGQPSVDDAKILEPEGRLVLHILHMHMRPRMIVDLYADNHFALTAQFRHGSICRCHLDRLLGESM